MSSADSFHLKPAGLLSPKAIGDPEVAVLSKAPAGYRFSATAYEEKEDRRAATKVKEKRKKEKEERRWRDTRRGRLRYRGRWMSCTAYPGHRTSKVRARGNTRAEMPPIPRRGRASSVPTGRRRRGPSTMGGERTMGWIVFRNGAEPIIVSGLVVTVNRRYKRLGMSKNIELSWSIGMDILKIA